MGVDLSSDMLLRARTLGLYDSLEKADLVQYLEDNSESYDLIVAAAVLIHFLYLDQIFALVKKRMKSGAFVFSVFDQTDEKDGLNSFLLFSLTVERILYLWPMNLV